MHQTNNLKYPKAQPLMRSTPTVCATPDIIM